MNLQTDKFFNRRNSEVLRGKTPEPKGLARINFTYYSSTYFRVMALKDQSYRFHGLTTVGARFQHVRNFGRKRALICAPTGRLHAPTGRLGYHGDQSPSLISIPVSLLLGTVSACFTKLTKECQFYCSLSLTCCQDIKTECYLIQFDRA